MQGSVVPVTTSMYSEKLVLARNGAEDAMEPSVMWGYFSLNQAARLPGYDPPKLSTFDSSAPRSSTIWDTSRALHDDTTEPSARAVHAINTKRQRTSRRGLVLRSSSQRGARLSCPSQSDSSRHNNDARYQPSKRRELGPSVT